MIRECIRRWIRIAWVCRVSVVSCLAGTVLFIFVTQARDLLLEYPSSASGDISSALWLGVYAARFSALLLVFWAIPVHAVARLSLNRSEWLTSPYGSKCDPCVIAAARVAFDVPATWLPRILGIWCFIAAMIGVVYTGIDLLIVGPERETTSWVKAALLSYFFSLLVFCGVFVLYALWRRQWLNSFLLAWFPTAAIAPAKPVVAGGRGSTGALGTIERRVAWAIFLLLVAVLAIPDLLDWFPRLLLVLVLLGAWVPALGWLAAQSHKTRMPLILTSIIALAFVSYFTGDVHNVTLGKLEKAPPAQLGIKQAVEAWMKANKCDAAPETCPSPVIVASAGGASRAAFMTASTLGLLLDASCFAKQSGPANVDSCAEAPAFAQRLFAISSVSGGSLGAVVYAQAYSDGSKAKAAGYAPPCVPGRTSNLWYGSGSPRSWRACLEAILAEDFLSPVFAGLGFRDVFSFIGRISPKLWPDRGQRVEKAWVDAYDKFVRDDKRPPEERTAGLASNFSSLRPDEAGERWRPLLLLNATSVDTGRRVIASHVLPTYKSEPSCVKSPEGKKKPEATCVRLFTDAYDLHEMIDVKRVESNTTCKASDSSSPTGSSNLADLTEPSIAAAAHNSARFPVVSPAGNLDVDGGSQGRLVDGGYFDNYGALTAFDLADTLRWEYDLYPFVLLITNDPSDTPAKRVLTHTGDPPGKFLAPRQLFVSVASAPVDSLLAVRSGHGSTALKLLRGLVDPRIYQSKVCLEEAEPGEQQQQQQQRQQKPPKQQSAANATCYSEDDGLEPCYAHVAVFPQQKEEAGSGKKESGSVKDVSMSWWLSKPVQNYLDAQLAAKDNIETFDRVCDVITRGLADSKQRRDQCSASIRRLTQGAQR